MTILRGRVTFRSLADRAKADVNRAARKVTDPDGDLQAMLYLYRPSSPALHRMEIPHQWFSSREAKDALVQEVVSTLVEIGGVTLVAMQWTVYMSTYDPATLTAEQLRQAKNYDLPEGLPQPSQDPKRIEAVAVNVFDAEIHEAWHRQIIRHPGRPPRFGAWEAADAMLVGLMIDPIAEALR